MGFGTAPKVARARISDVKPRDGSIMRYAAPLKSAAQRFAFMALVGATVGLIVLGKADTILIDRLRTAVTDAFAPILEALAQPIATVNHLVVDAHNLVNLQADNERLRDENMRLRQWEQVARELAAQNQALSDTLRFVPHDDIHSTTGRIIADSGGVFVRSLLVDVGARDGVARGQAAVAGDGLIGRIAEVGDISARVLLITDLNSRIPVMIESTRDHAILAGDNSDQPKLMYLPPNLTLKPGERIVTAGDGGAFPPGLPVGVISSVVDNTARVAPFADWGRLEYVRIVDYGLKGILGPSDPVSSPVRAKRPPKS
jgi:rod shape-determining protein MreC